MVQSAQDWQGEHAPYPVSVTRNDRGLSFEPDVVMANGDQIYWDQETILNKKRAVSWH
jgi:hypothetical protein